MKLRNYKLTILLLVGIFISTLVISCEIPTYALSFDVTGSSIPSANTTTVSCFIQNIGFKTLTNAKVNVGVNTSGGDAYAWTNGVTLGVSEGTTVTATIYHDLATSSGIPWIEGAGWDD